MRHRCATLTVLVALLKMYTYIKTGVVQTDTTVLNPVISPEAEGGQIHLNVVKLRVARFTSML